MTRIIINRTGEKPDTASAKKKIDDWLKQYNLSLSVSEEQLRDGVVGEYQNGSVFSYMIEIRIDPSNLRTVCNEERLSYDQQYAITMIHEVGHALMERLIDYSENLPEMETMLGGPYGDTYFDIFNDDCADEEDLVEDFAYGFLYGHGSLLQRCVEQTEIILSES